VPPSLQGSSVHAEFSAEFLPRDQDAPATSRRLTRRLVAENTLSPADLIWPIFVIEGEGAREPIASMLASNASRPTSAPPRQKKRRSSASRP